MECPVMLLVMLDGPDEALARHVHHMLAQALLESTTTSVGFRKLQLLNMLGHLAAQLWPKTFQSHFGCILLPHEAQDHDVASLPQLVTDVRQHGYDLCVPVLIQHHHGGLHSCCESM